MNKRSKRYTDKFKIYSANQYLRWLALFSFVYGKLPIMM